MRTNTPTGAAETLKRSWWLLLSFGIALLFFGGAATLLGQMMYSGVKLLIDDFGVMDQDFWIGVLRVVGSFLLFLTLVAAVISEMRAVIGKSLAAAKHQAKLWQQARCVVVACMGIIVVLSFVVTVIPGRFPVLECALVTVFLALCYLSFTHAKWSSLLQRVDDQ